MSQILRYILAAALAAILIVPALSQHEAPRRAPPQIVLTQQQVDGWIAVQSAVQAAQPTADAPDAKQLARLEAIVKKNGFAGIDEYEAVSENVAKVIVGMDPEKGTYVGAGPMIRKQIADVEADKTMRPAEKTAALDEAKAALAAAEAAPPSAGNIAIVSKSYGKLLQAVAGSSGRK